MTRSHAYDDYGRLASTTYPSSVPMKAVTVEHEYNRHGYLAKLKHGSTALVNVTEQTAYGLSATPPRRQTPSRRRRTRAPQSVRW